MFWRDRNQGQDANTFLIQGDVRHTYSDVFHAGDALFLGIGRSTVAILCEKSFETIVAYIGALRNDLVPLMIDAGIRPAAFSHLLQTYKPQHIFAPNTHGKLAGYHKIQTFGNCALYCQNTQINVVLHSGLAVLLPTSGSTGDPKCVRLSAKNINTCTISVCEYLRIDSRRIAISALPFHYSYGLSVLHNVLHSRGQLVLTEASVLDRIFWNILEKSGVTDFSGVPFMFELIQRMQLSQKVLDTLVCVTQAGGHLDSKISEKLYQKFTAANIGYYTMYGQTEASPRISYMPPEYAVEKNGSVGIPVSCGHVYIPSATSKNPEGELVYSGPNVCLGYAWSDADLADGDVFKGILKTGDQATIDADGFITIIGRRKRFVKLQGISINLDHFETTLKGQGVDCIVVGKENQILICHVGDHCDTLSDIIQNNFSIHPSSIKHFQIDTVPMTAAGKPDYMLIIKKYLS